MESRKYKQKNNGTMKATKTTAPAIRLENGLLILAINPTGMYGKEYHVYCAKDNHIFIYTEEEMLEMYGIAPKSMTQI